MDCTLYPFSLGVPLRAMTTTLFHALRSLVQGSHEFIGNTWSKSEVANKWDSQHLTADSESLVKASSQVV
eukprot:1534206-Rhodomonas_salina.1